MRIHCVSSHSKDSLSVVVFCYMLMCVGCFGLVVSTCQVIGYRKTPLMTPSCGEEITSTKPRWKRVFVCIFLFDSSMLLCVPPLHNIYLLRLWHDIAYIC